MDAHNGGGSSQAEREGESEKSQTEIEQLLVIEAAKEKNAKSLRKEQAMCVVRRSHWQRN